MLELKFQPDKTLVIEDINTEVSLLIKELTYYLIRGASVREKEDQRETVDQSIMDLGEILSRFHA
jgi:hypothetical protein